MTLESIRLQTFRSYIDESFEFGDGVNIIVGPNASGKTNLLEAVLVTSIGRSYRAKDPELIHFNRPWARIDAGLMNGNRTVKLERQADKLNKRFNINGVEFRRLQLQKTVPTVLFEPSHLSLLTGSPDLRRNYLDELIEQTVIGFAATRQAYRRSLAQRNSLLKAGLQSASAQIFAWNVRLSELGGRIVSERIKMIEAINRRATEIYRNLSNSRDEIKLEYKSHHLADQYESSMLKKLELNLERDCLLGFTSHGPHRDDIHILLNRQPVESAASRGETRSLVLTLKMLELKLIEKVRNQAPLLLLDDVFSELDGSRRNALTKYLKNYQTFITTTDADVVLKHFTESCNIIALT